MRTRLAAFSLAIAASSYIKLIIAGRSSYPGCGSGEDEAYQNWVIKCQEGHHYGVGDCGTGNGPSMETPCTACPPFKVSFTNEDYLDFSSSKDKDIYSCVNEVGNNTLYGIVMNTTEFAISITLLVLIILLVLVYGIQMIVVQHGHIQI